MRLLCDHNVFFPLVSVFCFACFVHSDSRLWPITTSYMMLMRKCPASTLSSTSLLKNPAVTRVLVHDPWCLALQCFMSFYCRSCEVTFSAIEGWNPFQQISKSPRLLFFSWYIVKKTWNDNNMVAEHNDKCFLMELPGHFLTYHIFN